jgi:ATP synthase protein I
MLGGLVCVVPSAYFTRFAFKYSGAKSALKITHSMYLGEAGKFVLTVFLFAVIFLLKVKNILNVDIAVLFVSYILIVIIGLVSAHIILARKNL